MPRSTASSIRTLTKLRVLALFEQVLNSRWLARAQHFTGHALELMVTRWPALGDLLGPRLRPTPRHAEARVHPLARSPSLNGEGSSQSDVAQAPAVETLLAQLAGATAWEARAAAAARLVGANGDGVVDGLARALHDPSVEVAIAAVETLAQRRDSRAVRAVLGVLENADGYFSPVTRAAAVFSLARALPDTELAPVFEAIRDVHAEVSVAAIAAVAERAPQLAASQLLPILRDRTGYFVPLVRLAAANALARTGTLSAAAAAELMQTEGDPAVQSVLAAVVATPAARQALGNS